MPKFTFTSPEGKNYDVEGPAGATKEQAFGILQMQLGGAKSSGSSPMDIPSGPDAAMGNRNAGVKPLVTSPADKLSGVFDATKTLGSSAIGGAAGMVGAGSSLLRGEGLKGAEANFGKITDAYTRKPTTEVGQKIVGRIGQGLEDSKLAGMVGLGGEAAALSRSMQGVGAATKPLVNAAGIAAKEKLPSMNIRLTPEMQELNAKARSYGITLQPHQLSDNKFVKILGETLNKIPGSGAKTGQNQTALERALIGEIGGDKTSTALTPRVFDQAMRRSGTTIDAITRKNTLDANPAFIGKIDRVKADALRLETGDNAKVISSWVDEIKSKIEDGKMSGTQFRKLNTKLGQKIRSTDSDLKSGLSDLQDTLLEAFNNGISGKDKAAFQNARMQYAKAKALAPIVGDPQGVSGAKVLGAVRNTKSNKELYAKGKAGSLADIADIGQLMKDPPSSGTGERNLIYGGVGALSGVLAGTVNPLIGLPAAGIYGAANMYNRFGPMLIPKKGQ